MNHFIANAGMCEIFLEHKYLACPTAIFLIFPCIPHRQFDKINEFKSQNKSGARNNTQIEKFH
jgi:hypothetical protein